MFRIASVSGKTKDTNTLSDVQLEIRKIPDSHLKWLLQQLFRQRAKAIYIVVATTISIGLNMVRPILTGKLFSVLWTLYGNRVEFNIFPDYSYLFSKMLVNPLVLKYALLILGLGLLSFLVNISVGILNEDVANRTERDIRQEFYESVQSKSMAFHDTAKVGELMSQATFDVRIINATISPGLRMLTQAIVSAIATFVILFTYDWRIACSIFILVPLYIWALRDYAKKIQPLTEKVQKQFGKCNAVLQENVSGIRVVRAFTGEKYETKKFAKEVEELKDDIIARGRRQALYFPPMILSASIAIAIGLSVLFIVNGSMSVEAAITINGVLIQLYDPTYMLSWVLFLTNMGLAGANRILGTMKEEEIIVEKPDAKALTDVKGKINYRNVSFSYHNLRNSKVKEKDETEKESTEKVTIKQVRDTLSDISFDVEPGEIVAILGPTGCGKSTLTKLLARMYNPDKGKIFIDDKNIQDLTLDSLRKNIGVIEQDIFLFSTTLRDNIAYGTDRDVNDEEIIEIAKAAQAHEFIMSFDDGYDTLVGERGVSLSGGQKQRIAIARAFLANPKILILDDSSSAIDAETEEKIQKAMDNLLKNRTVFIITHRLSTIKRANKIVVMRKGQIVSQGTHDSLLRTSNDYRRVFGRHVDLPPIEEQEVAEGAGGK
ncbi:MAG: ABC transporter ATP-binding protein [Candidatus Heimdallarchaeota archaeon]